MQLSTKLGFASLAMLGLTVVLALFAPHGPLAFMATFLACGLGALAAQRGTKWWLAVPGGMVAVFFVVLFIAFRAF